MKVILSNIAMPLGHTEEDLFAKCRRKLKCGTEQTFQIVKKSVDARDKQNIKIVYSVSCDRGQLPRHIKLNKEIKLSYEKEPLKFKEGKVLQPDRPIIIGSGPAGLFCGYFLAEYGFRPIIIERGSEVEQRTREVQDFFETGKLLPDSNIQFGEGGAGTFSDGKLVTRINDSRCDEVLKIFHRFGAPAEILYEAKPHIGTDKLRQVVKNMRLHMIEQGASFLFNTTVKSLLVSSERVRGVVTEKGETFSSNLIILAVGHSARDVYEYLARTGIEMEKKPFSVGVRIEHKQEFLNRAQYGIFWNHPQLKAADYQLSYREGERGCYSFCMCPGGMVVASQSEEGTVVTNGMSEYLRDGENCNSAIVSSVLPNDLEHDILAGVRFQRMLERRAFSMGGNDYCAPVQLSQDFLNHEKSTKFFDVIPTYPIGTAFSDFHEIFPASVKKMLEAGLNAFDQKIKGFSSQSAVLTGVETRTSAPLRILRNSETLESISAKGLFPAGEGAGYAGGITSAAVDGIRIAAKIIETYHPC